MMKALLAVRFRALLAGMTAQGRQKKKSGRGMLVLLAVAFLYLAAVMVGLMCLTFGSLAPAYHQLGLDWLYFAMAGLAALALSVFGGVFMTQNQLYDAKDNDLLLSMPIKPGTILLSRMLPLLGMNLVFCALVMVPAFVMYAIHVEFSIVHFLFRILAMLGVCFLAQAVCCLLGWGLRWLLRRMNRSLASLLYMAAFLLIYFSVYSQAGNIMNAIALSGEAIGAAVKSWIWPLYAMGVGCTGEIWYLLAFLGACSVVFGVVYWLLSVTFLHNATSRRSGRVRKLDMGSVKTGNAGQTMVRKEWLHFLGSPVYLTNCGLGILMTVALAVAGVIFRGKLLGMLETVGIDLSSHYPAIICGMVGVLTSMCFLSAPSVSLEGKNLWVLKSMPVSGKEILRAKLGFHLLLTTPVSMTAGFALSIAYGCGAGEIVLCGIVPGLLAVLCGLVGMILGLKWARLDWLSEAYPVKQGLAAGITMLGMMSVPLVLGAVYLLAGISAGTFLVLCALLLAGVCFGLYRLMVTWGVKKWDSL